MVHICVKHLQVILQTLIYIGTVAELSWHNKGYQEYHVESS